MTKTTPPSVDNEAGSAASLITILPPAPRNSKAALLVSLLTRTGGATLDQMVGATGWLPHTTRAARTRLKARGHVITSVKVDGSRTYSAIAPNAS
jgi:hypothetical protein